MEIVADPQKLELKIDGWEPIETTMSLEMERRGEEEATKFLLGNHGFSPTFFYLK